MGNICAIGPRASGKTTYLAALAYWPSNRGRGSDYTIHPLNDDSRQLADEAENVIRQGLSVAPTRIGDGIQSVDDLPYYSFKIETKPRWPKKPEALQLNVRDYPGEVFEKIAEPDLSDAIHQEFIEECLMKDVVGCLILLAEWERSYDSLYSRVMSRFVELMSFHDRSKDLRLAVAVSKCERGEIWPGRLDPETDLFGVHLKKTYQVLRDSLDPKNLRFYAISTFGVLERNDPRPNRIDDAARGGKASFLRDPVRWQPYNTIDPLYWLSKG